MVFLARRPLLMIVNVKIENTPIAPSFCFLLSICFSTTLDGLDKHRASGKIVPSYFSSHIVSILNQFLILFIIVQVGHMHMMRAESP
ncbi:uncharacterized protein BJ212DRAFT_1041256 [Suillus subaureus]|uniref:Uncharacterized protein n=1 Tax=Suillus subaureus TaxID=48587 RepID=A0A9P7J4A0_9AGAM|nr:uncharacterized protein BJ212DRAFT_1041256 [Suillus subaureus]KAG1802348.1 hypothetical protein BJ212DRAFT_1041256 [Suillus subaureus]